MKKMTVLLSGILTSHALIAVLVCLWLKGLFIPHFNTPDTRLAQIVRDGLRVDFKWLNAIISMGGTINTLFVPEVREIILFDLGLKF